MTQMGLSQQLDYNQRQTCPEWVQPGIVTQVISSIPSLHEALTALLPRGFSHTTQLTPYEPKPKHS